MKNKTKTKIVITMNHLDHSQKLYEALKVFSRTAIEGGDVYLNGLLIGHDVIIRNIQHIKFEEQ